MFSPDGQRIVTASAGDKTARLWNAASGQLLATLEGHAGYVWSAVFSPNGERIVTASSDDTARVWNAASGQLVVALQGHPRNVSTDLSPRRKVPWAAVFSPDGQRIVTVTSDATPRVFRVVTLSEIADLLAK